MIRKVPDVYEVLKELNIPISENNTINEEGLRKFAEHLGMNFNEMVAYKNAAMKLKGYFLSYAHRHEWHAKDHGRTFSQLTYNGTIDCMELVLWIDNQLMADRKKLVAEIEALEVERQQLFDRIESLEERVARLKNHWDGN
jgi:hypothetical protein